MQSRQLIQGRWVGAEEIDWLLGWILGHPQWSRKRIARELCAAWEWRDERQRFKDFAASSFLMKLERQGKITLPALRLANRRPPRVVREPSGWHAPAPSRNSFRQLGGVSVELVQAGTPAARQWAFYLDRYHYLGLRVVGENVGYLARDAQGRDLACLLFGAPAWRCAPVTVRWAGPRRSGSRASTQWPTTPAFWCCRECRHNALPVYLGRHERGSSRLVDNSSGKTSSPDFLRPATTRVTCGKRRLSGAMNQGA